MKIATVVGARPQFIKAAAVSRAIGAAGTGMNEVIIHTGQHYDENMSKVFFDELGIPKPGHNLGIGGGTHGQNTGRMLEAIEKVLADEAPDWVLVYGDTDSTLAGALAAVKMHIPIAHVEAGLRSFNRRMPEEINRVLTDHAASLLFTPTATATSNLDAEGIRKDLVAQVGDVMYDASIFYADLAKGKSAILNEHGLSSGDFVLATIHRAENTDSEERLRGIMEGLASSPKQVVLPLHPRTRNKLATMNVDLPSCVLPIEPVGYLDMMSLEANAVAIATDSGGVQKEAYFHGVPCITMRDETEWVELVDVGANRIVGADASKISDALATPVSMDEVPRGLYGNGDAADRIVAALCQ